MKHSCNIPQNLDIFLRNGWISDAKFEEPQLKYTDLDFLCFHFPFVKLHVDSNTLYNYEVQSKIFHDFGQKVDFQKNTFF